MAHDKAQLVGLTTRLFFILKLWFELNSLGRLVKYQTWLRHVRTLPRVRFALASACVAHVAHAPYQPPKVVFVVYKHKCDGK